MPIVKVPKIQKDVTFARIKCFCVANLSGYSIDSPFFDTNSCPFCLVIDEIDIFWSKNPFFKSIP